MMIIVIPKCITRKIILNDVHYHKDHHHHYLQIPCQSVYVLGCKMTRNSSVFCLPQIRVEADIQWYTIVLHAPGPESTLFYGVLLVFIIRSQVSTLQQAKLSDDTSFEETLATWPNKYHWLIWLMSPEKKPLAWNRTCWCKLQSLLTFSTFSKMLHSSAWKMCITNNNKNNIDFLFSLFRI